MSTVSSLRPMLDRTQWEPLIPLPATSAAGHFIIATPPSWIHPGIFLSQGTNTHYFYDALEDSWVELPGGTLGAHTGAASGCFHAFGPSGTATAGSSTTLTTNLTIPIDLTGYTVRLTGGTGAGQERVISSNTYGANCVLSVDAAWSVTPDSTSTYVIMSGRFWVFAPTGAAVVWKYYDVATNAWTAKSTTGLSATFGTDGNACTTSTTGWIGRFDTVTNLWPSPFASGTATAGGASTLTNSGKTWTVNQWANMQVRIVAGTGAGQFRVINSNTSTQLTVSAAWSVTPDATSQYVIEGVDDWIFLAGNNAVTLYRYAINGTAGLSSNAQATGDTWITVSPAVARAAAAAAGLSLNYISGSTDSRFTNESAILNGRRIYSFRGGATSTLDYYDVPSNSWTSGLAYGRQAATFTTNTSWTENTNGIFWCQKEATNRFYRFNAARNRLTGVGTLQYPNGTAILGKKTFILSYVDGGTTLTWLYAIRHTGTEMFRMLMI